MWMWCLGTWFSGGLGSVRFMVGLDVFSSLNESMIFAKPKSREDGRDTNH